MPELNDRLGVGVERDDRGCHAAGERTPRQAAEAGKKTPQSGWAGGQGTTPARHPALREVGLGPALVWLLLWTL